MFVGVECTFSANGTISVKRVQLGGVWQVVEQGRQWVDGNGRHILIMFAAGQAQELVLSSDTLTWQLKSGKSTQTVV